MSHEPTNYESAVSPLAGAAGEGEKTARFAKYVLLEAKPMSAEAYAEALEYHDHHHPIAQSKPEAECEWFRVDALICHVEWQAQELESARARLQEETRAAAEARGRHKAEVLDMLRDLRLPLIQATEGERLSEYAQGVNKERQAQNYYCRTKAYEYSPEGIGPDPVKAGEWDTLPKNGAAGPPQGEEGKEGRHA